MLTDLILIFFKSKFPPHEDKMSSSSTFKQYLRIKNEVIVSLDNVRSLRDQYLAATRENPTNLTKKEIDYVGKAFKNRLLTVKWDCEDLEELLRVCEKGESKSARLEDRSNSDFQNDILSGKCFLLDCRNEINKLMEELEETDSSRKIFNKHGITIQSQSNNNILSNGSSQLESSQDNQKANGTGKYERLLGDSTQPNEPEEVQFDKNQIESASIFNNALYDHLEQQQQQLKLNQFNNSSSHQVFNNLSRPVTNVYMNPNENEIILDMLETEYYNPPSGLTTTTNNSYLSSPATRLNYTVRKLLETDRNKLLGTIAFLFSFPILYVLLMIL